MAKKTGWSRPPGPWCRGVCCGPGVSELPWLAPWGLWFCRKADGGRFGVLSSSKNCDHLWPRPSITGLECTWNYSIQLTSQRGEWFTRADQLVSDRAETVWLPAQGFFLCNSSFGGRWCYEFRMTAFSGHCLITHHHRHCLITRHSVWMLTAYFWVLQCTVDLSRQRWWVTHLHILSTQCSIQTRRGI